MQTFDRYKNKWDGDFLVRSYFKKSTCDFWNQVLEMYVKNMREDREPK
jgi:hypothetical protein